MKKSKKNILFNLLVSFILITTIVLYIVLKIEIQNIEKEKLDLEQSIKALDDEYNIVYANVQKYQSAEIVMPVAAMQLNMVKKIPTEKVLFVKDEFDNLLKVIDKNYE